MKRVLITAAGCFGFGLVAHGAKGLWRQPDNGKMIIAIAIGALLLIAVAVYIRKLTTK